MTTIVKTLGIVATTTNVPEMNFQWNAYSNVPKENHVRLILRCGQGESTSLQAPPFDLELIDQKTGSFHFDDGGILVSGKITVNCNKNGYIMTFVGSMIRPRHNNISNDFQQSIIVAALLN